ncbi:hypothetical protein FR932_10525 [Moritella marina ATCC 15381]|uniref:Lipoprotein n=1 Tax=Moritella marina ATCC 15381 TaxID=1202962 RepID=A0A5J6WMF5_MORMI|nr:hypothetical protein [Moritella marina]QFI38250.1 hypothetical protein FR932_10525 [Moritella marina ATCC 15381]
MKKTILAVTIFASLLSGCITTGGSASYVELQEEGQDLYLESAMKGTSYEVLTAEGTKKTNTVNTGYQESKVEELENIRTVVNATFLTAKPVYERFSEEMINTPVVGSYFAAIGNAKNDEDIAVINAALSAEDKKIIEDFKASSVSQELLVGLKDVAVVVLANSETFYQLDTTALITSVDFSDMMAEKDRLSHTTDQLLYMNDTVVSAYNNYQVISAMSNAE